MGLHFEEDDLAFNGMLLHPAIRTLSEMAQALAYPDRKTRLQPDTPTYFMYRGVLLFKKIRYDITRIPQLDLCGERNKTFGHAHPRSPSGPCWPEIYEVLEGNAHFLIQKMAMGSVDASYLLEGKKGDRFLIPPGFGHVTINAGKSDLVLANLVSGDFESDYSLYAKMHGACVYEAKEGKILNNRHYGKFKLGRESAVKFSSQFSCYSPFKKNSLLEVAKDYQKIEFLEKPEKFR